MEYDDKVKNRLRRVQGQMGGVLRMMEDDKECKDVISQLSAVRKAVDRIIALLVVSNLEHCLLEEFQEGEEADTHQVLDEAVQLLIKSR